MDENLNEEIIDEKDEEGLDFGTIYENVKLALQDKETQELLAKVGISENVILKQLDSEDLIEATEQDTEASFSKKFLKYVMFKKLLQNYRDARLPKEQEGIEETFQTPEIEDSVNKANEESDKENFINDYRDANETGNVDKILATISSYQLFPWISEENKDKIFPTKLTTFQKNEFENYVTKIENTLDKKLESVEFQDYNNEQIPELEDVNPLNDFEEEPTEEVFTSSSQKQPTEVGKESSVKLYMDKTDLSALQQSRWELNPAATIQAFHENPNEPVANVLKLELGTNIDIALEDLMQLKLKGFNVRTEINGIMLNTAECNEPQEILECYNAKKDSILQEKIDTLMQESTTLDFNDPKASVEWVRNLGNCCSQMKGAPTIDKEELNELFEKNGIGTNTEDAKKFDFYSSDINESSNWVLTVAANQLLKHGRIAPELTERANEVLILQKDRKTTQNQNISNILSPKTPNIDAVQKKLSDMVYETIVTPDGKPNEKGIDGVGNVLVDVIAERQGELGISEPNIQNEGKDEKNEVTPSNHKETDETSR